MSSRKAVATASLIVPAAMALGLSADTSFRFLGAVLGVVNPAERGFLTGTAEAAVIALTLYSWAASARAAAWIAYAVVLVQSVPAFKVSGGYGGVVRTALGPVLLVVLLHLLLGLELKMSKLKTSGLVTAAGREIRERLVSYLGIGRRGADSAAIARSRAADRAVALVDRTAAAPEGSRRRARLSARLASSIDAARYGLDAPAARAAEAAVVARVVRRKSVNGLATISVSYDWAGTATETETASRAVERPASRSPKRPAAVPRPTRETLSALEGGTDGLLTATEAALVASQARGGTVTPSTIRTWRQRGHLTPVIEDDMTLYRRDDVVSAATRNGNTPAPETA
jgi:hypothetical protein